MTGESETEPTKPPALQVVAFVTAPWNEQPSTRDLESIAPAKPPTPASVAPVTVPSSTTPLTRPPAILPKNPADPSAAFTTKFVIRWFCP